MISFWNQLPRPFYVLAPMEQVTDVVFRRVVAKAGAPDVWYTEFANATGWVHAGSKGIGGRLVKTESEHPIVAQIWGGEPGDIQQFALYCAGLGYDGIDINMGCPAKSAIKSGGSALIRQPDLAAAAIAAAKKAGLPVSVKTRLGYSYVNEWTDWLGHLLRQDIAALTIHLRTKKEMSKVPAHWELIPEIKALRDQIAPNTLLIINGDIKNREHGEQLAKQYSIDGIMIGRGIFSDPFAFARQPVVSSKQYVVWENDGNTKNESEHKSAATPKYRRSEHDSEHAEGVTAHGLNQVQTNEERAERRSVATTARLTQDTEATRQPERELHFIQDSKQPVVEPKESSDETLGSDAISLERERYLEGNEGREREVEQKQRLIGLLYYHLNLYDQYATQTGRPFETLKRFFKIYIRDFDGASDMREQLMHTKSTSEVYAILDEITQVK